MTVAIALERFIAVHYPINYSQAMLEANALHKRVFKYVFSVTVLSVLFSATKFLEATVSYKDVLGPDNKTVIDHVPELMVSNPLPFNLRPVCNYVTRVLQPTAMRIHPYYSLYNNWGRLICLGIIPFAMLIYLNYKIYQDIKARRNRRFNSRY